MLKCGWWGIVVLWLCGCAAAPQIADSGLSIERLPPPHTLYRDPDRETAGAAETWLDPNNPRHLDTAVERARQPGAGPGKALRPAYLHALRGEREAALATLAKVEARYPQSVRVHWSKGWILFNLGDYRGALTAWAHAEHLHGGHPYWGAYSRSIAWMALGDTEAALAWWEAAQRSAAPHLDTPTDARRYFSHWRAAERTQLEALLTAQHTLRSIP